MKKSVFITGGSRGIGASCVRKFAQEGWNVAFTYNENREMADALVKEISDGNILALKLDLEHDLSALLLEEAFHEGKKFFGIESFDAAVINAGISRSGLLDWVKTEDLRALMEVNLVGAIYTARAASHDMIKSKAGSIVFISSMWGQRGASCESLYSATKGGLDSFGKSLAKELGPSGIRVNIVSPGVIDTDMNKGYNSLEMESLMDATPLGRMGNPMEVAEAVYFLSDQERSSFITGQILGVDGGIIA